MRQSDAVYTAMQNNGGFATFAQLYAMAPHISGSEWGTKTPFATVRRIVFDDPRFFKITPGLWALEERREEILQHFEIAPDRPAATEAFNHAYYQGLLLEIGSLRRHDTFVPHQDKNHLFLNRTLADIATLSEFHPFTFPEVLRNGRTVDVTWFNERRYPHAFFEVEHSTDIYNSLRKFTAFQDFRVEFHIVADSLRKREFEQKISETAYMPIQKRVKFLDYESLANLHSSEMQTALQRQTTGL